MSPADVRRAQAVTTNAIRERDLQAAHPNRKPAGTGRHRSAGGIEWRASLSENENAEVEAARPAGVSRADWLLQLVRAAGGTA